MFSFFVLKLVFHYQHLHLNQHHPGFQDALGGEYGARCGMSKSSNIPQQIHFLGAALQVFEMETHKLEITN